MYLCKSLGHGACAGRAWASLQCLSFAAPRPCSWLQAIALFLAVVSARASSDYLIARMHAVKLWLQFIFSASLALRCRSLLDLCLCLNSKAATCPWGCVYSACIRCRELTSFASDFFSCASSGYPSGRCVITVVAFVSAVFWFWMLGIALSLLKPAPNRPSSCHVDIFHAVLCPGINLPPGCCCFAQICFFARLTPPSPLLLSCSKEIGWGAGSPQGAQQRTLRMQLDEKILVGQSEQQRRRGKTMDKSRLRLVGCDISLKAPTNPLLTWHLTSVSEWVSELDYETLSKVKTLDSCLHRFVTRTIWTTLLGRRKRSTTVLAPRLQATWEGQRRSLVLTLEGKERTRPSGAANYIGFHTNCTESVRSDLKYVFSALWGRPTVVAVRFCWLSSLTGTPPTIRGSTASAVTALSRLQVGQFRFPLWWDVKKGHEHCGTAGLNRTVWGCLTSSGRDAIHPSVLCNITGDACPQASYRVLALWPRRTVLRRKRRRRRRRRSAQDGGPSSTTASLEGVPPRASTPPVSGEGSWW